MTVSAHEPTRDDISVLLCYLYGSNSSTESLRADNISCENVNHLRRTDGRLLSRTRRLRYSLPSEVPMSEDMTGAKARSRERIDEIRDTLLDLSHRIHTNPELRFQEHKASAWLADALSKAGFA